MIKLIIIARCMPEDVYPRSIEQPTAVLPGEKKFSVVVREPESWYIGRLALEIKKRYESLYKRYDSRQEAAHCCLTALAGSSVKSNT